MSSQYQYLGVEDSGGSPCECCGRPCPKRRVALDVVDEEGNRSGDVVRYGVVCASLALQPRDRRPSQYQADKHLRELEQKRRYAVLSACQSVARAVARSFNHDSCNSFGPFARHNLRNYFARRQCPASRARCRALVSFHRACRAS